MKKGRTSANLEEGELEVDETISIGMVHGQKLSPKYSPSPKIDTPKIDTFYENSRNFRNSKIFGEVLSKSPILGQNHKNDDLFSDFNIWWASSS